MFLGESIYTEHSMEPMIQKSEEDWQKELTPEQYDVLRQKGTERPFTGKFYNSHEKGMYVCAGCGAELFSSNAKFDSGTGWPSFTNPAIAEAVELRVDHSHGMNRTEVICRRCGGHLGHVFNDGPGIGGQRFCINSCSLDLKKNA